MATHAIRCHSQPYTARSSRRMRPHHLQIGIIGSPRHTAVSPPQKVRKAHSDARGLRHQLHTCKSLVLLMQVPRSLPCSILRTVIYHQHPALDESGGCRFKSSNFPKNSASWQNFLFVVTRHHDIDNRYISPYCHLLPGHCPFYADKSLVFSKQVARYRYLARIIPAAEICFSIFLLYRNYIKRKVNF